MKRITKEYKHNGKTWIISLSKLLERASFYGVRSLFLLFLVSKAISVPEEQALKVYGLYTGSFIFAHIIGGLIGDFLIGSKKASIFGGFIQALGAFVIAIPNEISVYIGLITIIIGNALYHPNIMARFGKSYLNKPKLMDSGFLILYLSINIGSLVAGTLIGDLGEANFSLGFISAGILMLISTLILLLISDEENTDVKNTLALDRRVWSLLIGLILIGIYWGLYDIGGKFLYEPGSKLTSLFYGPEIDFSWGIQLFTSSIFFFIFGTIAAVIWSFFHQKWIWKLFFAFLFTAIAFGLFIYFPENVVKTDVGLYLLIILSLAELSLN